MTEQETRYDRIALGYQRHWAPVIAPTARGLLDVVEPLLVTGRERILDLGTGTGTLARAAVSRWPGVNVDGIDASSGMLALAEDMADRELATADRRRLRFAHGFADDLPFDAAAFDVVISSFVLQLVPNRIRALREMRRVLRPGGWAAYVTWLQGDRPFAPDTIFDSLLEDLGIGGRELDGPSRDLASPGAAAHQLRRAGFRNVRAIATELRHTWEPEAYLSFLSDFDEEDLFSEFEPDVRARLETELLDRLRRLPPAELTLRSPVVTVTGRRGG